jgi:hypothetical protein
MDHGGKLTGAELVEQMVGVLIVRHGHGGLLPAFYRSPEEDGTAVPRPYAVGAGWAPVGWHRTQWPGISKDFPPAM